MGIHAHVYLLVYMHMYLITSTLQFTVLIDLSVQLNFQDIYEDPLNPSPSPVVHVRGLTDIVTERDLIDALQSFGTIRYKFVY